MATLNREAFFAYVQKTLFSSQLLADGTHAGMEAMLEFWELTYPTQDDRWLAYMLATVHHETGPTKRFVPKEEVGKGKGKPYGKPHSNGQRYYGRGLIQLTHYENYVRMAEETREPLVEHPELALRLDISVLIVFHGMIGGLFTGRRLFDYLSGDHDDWINARRIVNGLDKAKAIAGYAQHYYHALCYRGTTAP